MNQQLKQLCSADFSARVAFTSSPTEMRMFIRASPEFRAMAEAFRTGQISEALLAGFVNEVLDHLRGGEYFSLEPAVAAVAVLLEQHSSDFAEKFLHDLAAISVSELAMAKHVARKCLDERMAHLAHPEISRIIEVVHEAPHLSFRTDPRSDFRKHRPDSMPVVGSPSRLESGYAYA